MIEEVTLLNFISHARSSIALKPGITIFVGRNGAGKSTVIDAITYALYGHHTRGVNETLVKEGAPGAAVSLYFSAENKHYLAERKLSKRGVMEGAILKEVSSAPDRAVLRQLASGERRQLGEHGVSGAVAGILGLDYDHMRIAGIIQQGELDSIINLGPKDLKDLVNSVTGTDRLDTAYAEMGKLIGSFRERIRQKHAGHDDTHIDSMRAEIAEGEEVRKSSEGRLQTLEGELRSLEGGRDGLSDEIGSMQPLKEKAESLQAKVRLLLNHVRAKRAELVEEKKELEDVSASASSSLRKVKEEAAVDEERQLVKREQERNDATLLRLAREVGELTALRDKPSEGGRTIAEARASLELAHHGEEIRAECSTLESRIKLCTEEIVRLEGAKGELKGHRETALRLEFKDNICPLCGSHVERINELFDRDSIDLHLREHEESIRTADREKTDLEARLKQAQSRKMALEQAEAFLRDHHVTSLSDLEALERENRRLEERISLLPERERGHTDALEEQRDLKRRSEELGKTAMEIGLAKEYLREHRLSSEEDLGRLNDQVESLARATSSIPENVEELQRVMMVPRPDPSAISRLSIDRESEELVGEIKDIARETEGFDESEYAALKERLEKLQRETIPSKNREVGIWKNRVDESIRKIEELRRGLIVLQEVAEYVKLLQRIRDAVYYRDGPVSITLRSWALNQISSKASEYARLFEIGVSQLTLKEKAKDMTIECYGKRGRVETASLSGGEKVAIALALRFALAYVMGGYKLDFIFLDEPTVHLDVERKSRLVEIVSRLGGENSPLKQLVIITHDSEIFENAEVDEVWNFEQTAEGTRVTRATQATR